MLKDTFCSSPWFHIRLTYNGDFQECRWFKDRGSSPMNIRDTSIIEFYNSDSMKQLRTEFLDGKKPIGCSSCYYEDDFGKLSGRSRQLLKSGVTDQFDLQMRASPHYEHFLHSANNEGHSNHFPTDLQIDLGSFCNSACIMCDPVASSRLRMDYVKLHQIDPGTFNKPDPYYSWPRDALEKFTEDLITIPNLKYIHFLGGETLYDTAFYHICRRLVESGRSRDIVVGTTTNGTIYDEQVERLIGEFKEFHLGISIESTESINDYIRYPGKVNQILTNIDKFLALRKHTGLYVSLRITPNIFTAYELDQLFEFMIDRQVIAESCNILHDPSCLRIELMPNDIRQEIINKIGVVINKHQLVKSNQLNIRKTNLIDQVVADTVIDYYNFVKTYTVPDNVEEDRHRLIRFLKGFETLRNNSILDYAPRYTDFLRHYGY